MSQAISNSKEERQEDYEQSLREQNFKGLFAELDHQSIKNKIANYQVKSWLINIDALNKSKYTRIKKYKQAVYFGEIVNGKRHGLGIILYHNQRVYQGQWEVDLKHGQGYQLFSNQCIYQGSYVNGRPEGKGMYQWLNGQFYQGQWLNGLKHGPGIWKGAKGDSYVGQWKFGKADGVGVHVWINGDRYQGQFKNSMKHGQGTQKFASEDIYTGSYAEGKPHGYGEYYWKNGSYYKGSFERGFRQGSGIWKRCSDDGDRYQGQYARDKKHGYGVFTWCSGNIYKGNYENDQREGYGQMYWTDGSFYKGSWKKGSQNGQGIISTPEQGIRHGIFSNNSLVQLYEEEQPQVPNIQKRMKKRRNHRIQSNPNKIHQIQSSKQHRVRLSSSRIIPKEQFRKKGLLNSSQADECLKNNQNSIILGVVFKKLERIKEQPVKKIQANRQYTRQLIPHSSVRIHDIDRKRVSSLSINQISGRREYRVVRISPKLKENRKKVKHFNLGEISRKNQSTVL